MGHSQPEQASLASRLQAPSAPLPLCSSNLASDIVVLAFQNLLPSEQGLVQGQDARGEDTGCGAPGVKHARLHFEQDKRAIM